MGTGIADRAIDLYSHSVWTEGRAYRGYLILFQFKKIIIAQSIETTQGAYTA